jgi:AcrR family transcriptional regulator
MAQEPSTRERIVLATIETLEAEGMAALTIRGIAERAGVNVAAVNYHFGSKDRLLDAVMEQTLRHGLRESLDELRDAVTAARAGGEATAVRNYLREFAGNMIRYPRLTEAHFHDALTRQAYEGTAVREFNRFMTELFDVVRPALPPGTEADQRATLAQFWYALIGTTVMPRLLEDFLGSGDTPLPSDPPLPAGYLDRLLDTFLA